MEDFAKSEKLRGFLVGVRISALILGLFITKLNEPGFVYPVFPFNLSGLGRPVITFFLISYHFIACFWMLKFHASANHIKLLVLADVTFGTLTMSILGSPYVFLAIMLPALESYCFLGKMWGLSILGIFGVIFIIILMGEYTKIINIPQEEIPVTYDVKDLKKSLWWLNIEYFLVMIPLIVWSYNNALALEEEKYFMFRRGEEEKRLINENNQSDKDTIQGLSNALMDKDQTIAEAQKQIERLQNEVEKNYQKYHEQKNQYVAQNESFKSRENEITTSFDNKIKKIQQDNADLSLALKKTKDLMDATTALNKSLNLQEVYVSVIDRLIKLAPVQTCILFMLDTVNKRTEIFAEMVYSPYSDFFRNFSVRIGCGIVGISAELQKIFKIDAGSIVIEGKEYQGLLNQEKSALVVPILYEEEILGLFYLGKQEEYGFTPESVDLIKKYADIAAISLQNAQLFQKTVSGGMFDDLTGFYNALYFNERFAEEVRRCRRYKIELSLALIEIDNFAEFNDEFGSSWADDVLQETSDVIREHARETDIVARIQAGQYVMVLVHTDKRNAYIMGEKIRTAFEMKNIKRMRRSRASTTLSIGVASFPYDAKDKEGLITAVEKALEFSKNKGGNTTGLLQNNI